MRSERGRGVVNERVKWIVRMKGSEGEALHSRRMVHTRAPGEGVRGEAGNEE